MPANQYKFITFVFYTNDKIYITLLPATCHKTISRSVSKTFHLFFLTREKKSTLNSGVCRKSAETRKKKKKLEDQFSDRAQFELNRAHSFESEAVAVEMSW